MSIIWQSGSIFIWATIHITQLELSVVVYVMAMTSTISAPLRVGAVGSSGEGVIDFYCTIHKWCLPRDLRCGPAKLLLRCKTAYVEGLYFHMLFL